MNVACIPKGTISRLLTVDSKVSLGAFRAGEDLGACYEQLLSIPVENFPTSLVEMTGSLDEAVLKASRSQERSETATNFPASVAMSFSVASQRREESRQKTAKTRTESMVLARERRLQEREEIQRHRAAVRTAATRERERQSERQAELQQCRSEAYRSECAIVETERKHKRRLVEAAVHGTNEARFERALKSVHSAEEAMQLATQKGSSRVRQRVGSVRPRNKHVDIVARGRCMKNAKKLREERSRMVSKACDALELAKQNIHSALKVPYPDEESCGKVLKSRDMVLGALAELDSLVERGHVIKPSSHS